MHILKEVPLFSHLRELNPHCKAIFWDMDGTILKTESLHAEATLEILNKYHPTHKHTRAEIELPFTGMTDESVIKSLKSQGLLTSLEPSAFIQKKNQYLQKILPTVSKERVLSQEVHTLIKEAHKNNLPQILVTSSERIITHMFLEFLGIKEYFKFIITCEDTLENKPSPMPYLHAMKINDLAPSEVIIFEDSPTGLEAAKSSGAVYCQASWYRI